MNIYINCYQLTDGTGKTIVADAQAVVEHSPREGFDNDKIAALEKDLTLLINKRLKEALTTNN